MATFAIRKGGAGDSVGALLAGRFDTYEAAETSAERIRTHGLWASVEEVGKPSERVIQALGARLVQNEVIYCVSSLVSTLAAREWDGSDGIDPDDLALLSYRQPDADDYREAARDLDRDHDGSLEVFQEDDRWRFRWTSTEAADTGNPDLVEYGDSHDDTEVGAWRAGFDYLGADHPDGAQVYEHWIVSDFLADALAERGESVAKDIAGLTIWGRCTTGQSMALDHVIQQIALATYGEEA